MKPATLLICLTLLATSGSAQTLEDWLEAAPDPEALAIWLDELRASPLNLNRATADEIAALPLFDLPTAIRIIDARTRQGYFRSISQVLTIQGLTTDQRELLRTFATVRVPRSRGPEVAASLSTGATTDTWERAADWWMRGRADFRRPQGPRGFVFLKHVADRPAVAGQVSAGIELQPHVTPSRVLIGEFQDEYGTGLVFASAYGMANWLSTREGNSPGEARGLTLRPSSNRQLVLRGAALELRRQPFTLNVLGSRIPLNAEASNAGVERITEGESGSSAELDQARRDQVDERLLGFTAQCDTRETTVGLGGYEARYTPELSGAKEAVLPQLTGNRVAVGSVFTRMQRGVVQFSGELAASRPGGHARQAALEARQEHFGLILYHIHADADFFSPRAKPWGDLGEAASNANRVGVRTHADWPQSSLWMSASTSRTPFRTSTLPLRRSDSDFDMLWRVTFRSALRLDFSAGRRQHEEYTELIGSQRVVLDRGRMELHGGDPETYRIRYEIRSATRTGQGAHPLGTLLFLQAKARLFAADLWGRVTFFHLSSADVATAVAETVPIGGYPLVPLSGTGRRAALMVARNWHGAALALKVAQTHCEGSGQVREDLEFALQLSYRRY